MPTTKVTWEEIKRAFLDRLGRDRLGNVVFWTDAATHSEIDGLLEEAMYYWGILSYNFRERLTLELKKDQQVYDLRTLLPSFFQSSTTNQDLTAQMEHHLLEPVGFSVTSWAGTTQFELQIINESLERRRDQFLMESGIWIEHALLTSGLPTVGSPRWELPNDVIDVRRLGLRDITASPSTTHIWPTDKRLINHSPTLTDSPEFFTRSDVPLKQVEFYPVIDKIYKVDLFSVRSGARLPLGGILAMGVPDEFAWVVKWGALADVLGRDGSAFDPQRAEYCETRYRQGVRLARQYPAIMTATLAAATHMPIVSLHALDSHRPGWQNESQGPPDVVAMVGRNLLVVVPEPDADDTYSLELDILRPAPVEANDPLPLVDHSSVDAIVDYAFHIATFKEGGAEFQGTMRQADNVIRLAGIETERLRAQSVLIEEMLETGSRESKQRLRRSQPQIEESIEVIHA